MTISIAAISVDDDFWLLTISFDADDFHDGLAGCRLRECRNAARPALKRLIV
jgi:hypothetical protein